MKQVKKILAVIVIVLAVLLIVTAILFALFKVNKKSHVTTTETATVQQIDQAKDKTDAKPEDVATDEQKGESIQEKDPWTVWSTDTLKLREDASAESEVLDVINAREELTATGEKGDWLWVTYGDKQGFVSKEFTTTDKPEEPQQLQTVTPLPASGIIVCIDPGHQRSGDSTPEPNGPGSDVQKARVTGGTSGAVTGVSEYELNFTIAQQLRTELQNRGYTVYMTRESHDVNISNKERAEFATSVGAHFTVRIHANGSTDPGISGALTMAPSAGNPYVSYLAAESQRLGQNIIDSYCAATGMNNQGVVATDTMTGINWCTSPVTIIEMGYMTNATDDTNMQDPGFQQKMVWGIANGIDAYCGR